MPKKLFMRQRYTARSLNSERDCSAKQTVERREGNLLYCRKTTEAADKAAIRLCRILSTRRCLCHNRQRRPLLSCAFLLHLMHLLRKTSERRRRCCRAITAAAGVALVLQQQNSISSMADEKCTSNRIH